MSATRRRDRRPADDDRRVRGPVLQQHLLGLLDLVPPGARGRVVDRQHQVGRPDGAQPRLDHRPGLEPVRQRDARRSRRPAARRPAPPRPGPRSPRAAPRSARRRSARPRPPRRPPRPSRTPRRHRRRPRRPARRPVPGRGRTRARSSSTVLPEACRGQPGAWRHPVHVRPVADHVVHLGQRGADLRGDPALAVRDRGRRPAAGSTGRPRVRCSAVAAEGVGSASGVGAPVARRAP